MKKRILKFIGISVMANIVAFIVGILYLGAKLTVVANLGRVNPFSIIARSLPGIAITNSVYFVVDWFGVIIINVFLSSIIYIWMRRNSKLRRRAILGIPIICTLYIISQFENCSKSSEYKTYILVGTICINSIYTYIYTRFIYNKCSLNKKISQVRKSYRFYMSRDLIIQGKPRNLAENNNSEEYKIERLTRNTVDYEDKKRTDIIQEILDLIGEWLKIANPKIHKDKFRELKSIIQMLNKEIEAINMGVYLSSIQELQVKKVQVQTAFKVYKESIEDHEVSSAKQSLKEWVKINLEKFICSTLIISIVSAKLYIVWLIYINIINLYFIIGIVIGALIIVLADRIIKWYIDKKANNEIIEKIKVLISNRYSTDNYMGFEFERKIYYVINNKLLNSIMIVILLCSGVFVLGIAQSTVELHNADDEFALPQIIFENGQRVQGIIINNDKNYIVYYDTTDKRIKEIEKLNGSYVIDHIEYNQPKLKENKEAEIYNGENLKRIHELSERFLELYYPKKYRNINIKEIQEIYRSDNKRKEQNDLYASNIKVIEERERYKALNSTDETDIEIPLQQIIKRVDVIREKKGKGLLEEEIYEVYINCYFYDRTEYIKLYIREDKELYIYDINVVTRYE